MGNFTRSPCAKAENKNRLGPNSCWRKGNMRDDKPAKQASFVSLKQNRVKCLVHELYISVLLALAENAHRGND